MDADEAPMFKHRQRTAWQRGMDLCAYVYHLVEALPCGERSGLRSQLTCAAFSVPSNIAEGTKRKSATGHLSPNGIDEIANVAEGSKRESVTGFIRSLVIARASLAEVDAPLAPVARLGYAPYEPKAQQTVLSLARALNALIRKLRTPSAD